MRLNNYAKGRNNNKQNNEAEILHEKIDALEILGENLN